MSSRTYAADSFDEIRVFKAKILEDEKPKCPVHPGRLLFECLRSSSKCSDSCPLMNDWIGPEGVAVDHGDCCG